MSRLNNKIKQHKKIIFNVMMLLCALYFITLFFYDIATTEPFIHFEVIDKYPKYLTFQSIKNEIGKPFDANNGEACVTDPVYSVYRCANDKISVSRTRNLNYFFDYVDAIFTKFVTIKIGMVSHVLFTLLTVLFFFLGISNIPNISKAYSMMLSSFFLCTVPVLEMNCVLYRSGKIITAFFVAYLFWLFNRILSKKHLPISEIIITVMFSCILVLADELAVALAFLFVIVLLFFKFIKFSLIYSVPLIWYLLFRFFIEPYLSLQLNGIKIILFGGYSDLSTFFVININIFYAIFKAIIYHLKSNLGAVNSLGATRCVIISIFLIGCFSVSAYYLNRVKCTLKSIIRRHFRILLLLVVIIMYWSMVIYMMALRHSFIIVPPSYGSSYYYIVTLILFYAIILFCIIRIKHSAFLLAIILIFIATGNYVNIRQTRSQLHSQAWCAEWVTMQKTICEFITQQKFPENDPIYIRHKNFLDCYRK